MRSYKSLVSAKYLITKAITEPDELVRRELLEKTSCLLNQVTPMITDTLVIYFQSKSQMGKFAHSTPYEAIPAHHVCQCEKSPFRKSITLLQGNVVLARLITCPDCKNNQLGIGGQP